MTTKQTEPKKKAARKTTPKKTEPVVISQAAPKTKDAWKVIAILLILFYVVPQVGGCAWNIVKDKLNPFGWFEFRAPDPPPNPFQRERKTRPDKKEKKKTEPDRRGIIWRFEQRAEDANDLAAWVKKNRPKTDSGDIYDVADAFYDAADAIQANPEIDEPAEAVAEVRKNLLRITDRVWVPFLEDLDDQANGYGVTSIEDAVEFYYVVADALYDSATVGAGADPESGSTFPPPSTPEQPTPDPAPAPTEQTPAPRAQNTARYPYYGGWGWWQ